MATQLKFAKLHLSKLHDFWTDETKVKMFSCRAQHHCGENQTQHISIIPTVKQVCGGLSQA